MTKRLLLTVPFVLLTACVVTDREPIVLMQDVSVSQYETDLAVTLVLVGVGLLVLLSVGSAGIPGP